MGDRFSPRSSPELGEPLEAEGDRKDLENLLRSLAATDARQTDPDQSGDPLAAHWKTLVGQFRPNLRRSVGPAAAFVDRLTPVPPKALSDLPLADRSRFNHAQYGLVGTPSTAATPLEGSYVDGKKHGRWIEREADSDL